MRLEGIEVRRLPGIEEPVRIEGLAPGINLVVGPNGSGKSSLCRAVDATLWPDGRGRADDEVETIWRLGELRLRAELAGGVRWTAQDGSRAEPALPSAALRRCQILGLRDLLDDDAVEDRALAERLRVQMAGGFDLRAAAEPFTLGARHASAEARTLREARTARRRLEGERRSLAREVDSLPELASRREAAAAAGARLQSLEAARALIGRREQLTARQRERSQLPPSMDALRGDELDRLKGLEREHDTTLHEAAEAQHRLAEAQRRRQASALPAGPVDSGLLGVWAARARALAQRELEVTQRQTELDAARSELDGATSRLSGRPEAGRVPELAAAELEAVEAWVRRAGDIEAERARLDRRLDALRDAIDPAADLHEEERRAFDRAVQLLEAWRAAQVRSLRGPWLRAVLASVLMGGLGGAAFALGQLAVSDLPPVVATVLTTLSFGLPGPIAALPTVVAVALVGLALAAPWGRERQRIEREFAALAEASRVEALADWAVDAVSSRLQQLGDAIRRADALRDRRRELEEATHARAALDADASLLADERRRLCEAFAVTPGSDRGPLSLADLFDRLQRQRAARHRVDEAKGALDGARERLAADRADLVAAIREVAPSAGLAAVTEGGAGGSIEAVLDDLRGRSEGWRQADGDAAGAEREIEGVARRRQGIEERRAELLRLADLDPADPDAKRHLEERCGRVEEFVRLSKAIDSLENEIAGLCDRLAGDPRLATLGRDEIEREIASCTERAEQRDDVVSEIAKIRQALDQVERGSGLEAADAAERAALEALEARRDERMLAVAGEYLLDDVESEFEQTRRPAVLERAMELFSAFCEHRYALRLDTDAKGASFSAVEVATGRERQLEELSDGTRMQLLLAARLAFPLTAGVAAAGEAPVEPLPLFLDEALTASDPGRFRAVVESLLWLARQGQQIFYLTCSSGDVDYWQEIALEKGAEAPHVVDLAEVRKLEARRLGGARLTAPVLAPVPEPGDDSPALYGARLGVAIPGPLSPLGGVHLFHLLRDELPLLHRLLAGPRIETVGQWQLLGEARGITCGLEAPEVARIDAWAALAERFFDEVAVGRGAPVDRAVLHASDAVSPRFLGPLSDLARDLGGDARALLEACKSGGDPRSKGFRDSKRQELTEYLREAGHLVDTAPHDPATLRALCLAHVAPWIEQGVLTPDEASLRVGHWLTLVSGGAEPAVLDGSAEASESAARRSDAALQSELGL